MTGRLAGVGVGPGDPELITVKARRLIEAADVVAYPVARHGRSVARGAAAPYLTGQLELALTYPVTTEQTDHPGGYAGALRDFYDDCARRLAEHLDAGRDVAVLCEGDPLFYGSYMYLHDRLAARYPNEVVAGVTAFSAAAAGAHVPLARHDDVLTVLPGTLPPDVLAARLEATDAAVVMKLGRTFDGVRAAVAAAGLTDRAIYVERASSPRQRIAPLAEVDGPVPYMSLVLIPAGGLAESSVAAAGSAPFCAGLGVASALGGTGPPAADAGPAAAGAGSAGCVTGSVGGERPTRGGAGRAALAGSTAADAGGAAGAAMACGTAADGLGGAAVGAPRAAADHRPADWAGAKGRVVEGATGTTDASADTATEATVGPGAGEHPADWANGGPVTARAGTVSAARASLGEVVVVGLGPGGPEWLTPEARAELEAADELVGYDTYLARVPVRPGQGRHPSGNRVESDRARHALSLAAAGARVAVVSSGDPGIFAMAAAVIEEAREFPGVPVRVVPGVSAMQAAAARVGAPLGHDFCVISLSDNLKPWAILARRLHAAGVADLALALYNPASRTRRDQLAGALDILSIHRPPETPVVVARAVGGADETVVVTTLAAVDLDSVDMRTLLIVGSRTTRALPDGRVYTPRGYPE